MITTLASPVCVVGVLVVALAGGAAARQTTPVPSIEALQWLEGTWVASVGATRFEERWTPPAGGAMLAVSRTIRGERMVGFEFLRIVSRDGGLFYIAQPGGRPPVEFRLTSNAAGSAVFENPQHDHPRVIRYTRSGTSLTAEVEGVENGKPAREVYSFTLATAPR